jgi:hypothetical protein
MKFLPIVLIFFLLIIPVKALEVTTSNQTPEYYSMEDLEAALLLIAPSFVTSVGPNEFSDIQLDILDINSISSSGSTLTKLMDTINGVSNSNPLGFEINKRIRKKLIFLEYKKWFLKFQNERIEVRDKKLKDISNRGVSIKRVVNILNKTNKKYHIYPNRKFTETEINVFIFNNFSKVPYMINKFGMTHLSPYQTILLCYLIFSDYKHMHAVLDDYGWKLDNESSEYVYKQVIKFTDLK